MEYDIEKYKDGIMEIIKEESQSDRRGVDGPTLGVKFISKFGGKPLDLLGIGVEKFVKLYLSKKVKIYCDTGKNKNVFSLESEGANILKSTGIGHSPRPKYYDKNFWNAFSTPKQQSGEELKRIISVIYPIDVKHIPASDAVPESYLEIPDEFISQNERIERSEHAFRVHENIRMWLSKNNLERDQFLVKGTQEQAPKYLSTNEVNMHIRQKKPLNEMYRNISSLSSLDKGRIFIPLDVVEKIFEG
jgi:hypothetical protein